MIVIQMQLVQGCVLLELFVLNHDNFLFSINFIHLFGNCDAILHIIDLQLIEFVVHAVNIPRHNSFTDDLAVAARSHSHVLLLVVHLAALFLRCRHNFSDKCQFLMFKLYI